MLKKVLAALIMVGILIASAIGFAVLPSVAVAQEAGSTTLRVGDFIAPLQPYIVELVTLLVSALVGWISMKVNTLTGLKVDAAQRDLLHKALENGLMAGVHAAQKAADDKTIDVHSVIVAEGIRYAQSYVPGAIKYFGLSPEKLGDMIRAKIPTMTDA